MADDQPLSSEEMIRRAREGFSGRPEPLSSDATEPGEESELLEDLLPTDIAPRQSRPRHSRRHKPLPPDPFGARQRPLLPQAKARALGVISALAMLVLGLGIALALFASNTP